VANTAAKGTAQGPSLSASTAAEAAIVDVLAGGER
jgi:hypothetical protein